jgi:hypothetical protein
MKRKYVKYDYPPEHPEWEEEDKSEIVKQGKYFHSGEMTTDTIKKFDEIKRKWREKDERR